MHPRAPTPAGGAEEGRNRVPSRLTLGTGPQGAPSDATETTTKVEVDWMLNQLHHPGAHIFQYFYAFTSFLINIL